jgi:uncharacterized cupin superfamily protein
VLRVINDDYVAPDRGFGTHPHQDMEIVTYVLEGELGHKDSMGNGSVIKPGEVQRMSAGTGVRHSEMNPSKTETVHLLQIWIEPDKAGYPPSYEQKAYSEAERRGKLRVVASPDGRDGSVTIHQDATLASARSTSTASDSPPATARRCAVRANCRSPASTTQKCSCSTYRDSRHCAAHLFEHLGELGRVEPHAVLPAAIQLRITRSAVELHAEEAGRHHTRASRARTLAGGVVEKFELRRDAAELLDRHREIRQLQENPAAAIATEPFAKPA